MKTMSGAHDEGTRENPTVRSKFDKSQGKGLPAPHLTHPGETAKETGSKHPGHNENGHKLPTERSVGLGGSHLRHSYTPGEMGAPMIHGVGLGHAKNSRLTDGAVVHHSRNVTYGAMKPHLKEPDPVHAGSDKHSKQHTTGHTNNKMGGGTDRMVGASKPQRMEDSSKRSSAPHGMLNRDRMKART